MHPCDSCSRGRKSAASVQIEYFWPICGVEPVAESKSAQRGFEMKNSAAGEMYRYRRTSSAEADSAKNSAAKGLPLLPQGLPKVPPHAAAQALPYVELCRPAEARQTRDETLARTSSSTVVVPSLAVVCVSAGRTLCCIFADVCCCCGPDIACPGPVERAPCGRGAHGPTSLQDGSQVTPLCILEGECWKQFGLRRGRDVPD